MQSDLDPRAPLACSISNSVRGLTRAWCLDFRLTGLLLVLLVGGCGPIRGGGGNDDDDSADDDDGSGDDDSAGDDDVVGDDDTAGDDDTTPAGDDDDDDTGSDDDDSTPPDDDDSTPVGDDDDDTSGDDDDDDTTPSCPGDQVVDCDGGCTDASWIGDGVCDAPLDCATFGRDGGDCCSAHTDCGSTGYCDAWNTCIDVFDTWWTVTVWSAESSLYDANGDAWDFPGGLPDPYVEVLRCTPGDMRRCTEPVAARHPGGTSPTGQTGRSVPGAPQGPWPRNDGAWLVQEEEGPGLSAAA